MPLKLFGFPGFRRHISPAHRKPNGVIIGGVGKATLSDAVCRCPSSFLPVLVAFIFIFTISQLFVIHRTIETYNLRNEAYQASFISSSPKGQRSPGLQLSLADLEFLKQFVPLWEKNGSVGLREWKMGDWRRETNYNRINQLGQSGRTKPICPLELPVRQENISIHRNEDILVEEILRANPLVTNGGSDGPPDCEPRNRVLIIIPYSRDRIREHAVTAHGESYMVTTDSSMITTRSFRWSHLKILVSVLHPMLQRQQLAYRIVVAEQYGQFQLFNKGLIMNAAFLLALNSTFALDFDCVIFHDVDLVPLNFQNMYSCSSSSPRHLSVAIDSLDNRLPYASLVGGALALSLEHFLRVNGYSNLYWGWGGEDDDMSNRLIANGLKISRPSEKIARYTMLKHERRDRSPNQFIESLIRTSKLRFGIDGLTTAQFRLRSSPTNNRLYTHFLLDVGQPAYFLSPAFTQLPKHGDGQGNGTHV